MSSRFMFLMDGNEAVARGAIDAGCRFYAGYPITPATSIYQHMLSYLPVIGGICLQGEDEIASIGFCLGAAIGGIPSMTATSGPGISLCSEQISFAIGGEIPVVIVDVQRLGPSTGSATKGADGDIMFLRWGNSGGLPVIVLAPVDARDCYLLTRKAFKLAERYRCPVFIASNKEIAQTKESVCLPEMAAQAGEVVVPKDPHVLPNLVRITSSTHGSDGYISTDPAVIEQAILKLRDKLSGLAAEISCCELDGDQDDPLLIISYGVSVRAARQCLARLRRNGVKVSLLVLKTLFPVPEQASLKAIKDRKRVLVVEMNLGQYVLEIERLAGNQPVEFLGKMNGDLISPDEIMAKVSA